jgi:energy-coupling factor transporter ATP-binding protein EcfA2
MASASRSRVRAPISATMSSPRESTQAMLNIEDLADRAPFQLLGGQKKKVAIATVLDMSPEVLLFDEPTAALLLNDVLSDDLPLV